MTTNLNHLQTLVNSHVHKRVKPGDTVVFWQDRFSRNFEEGVAIQKDLDYVADWGAGYCSPCRRR